MLMGELYRSLGRCDSHQGCVKGIRNVCQLMERCDGHWGGVNVLGDV